MISQHEFARIWNTLLSKVRSMVRTVKNLPVTVVSFGRSCEEVDKWLFVTERLNSDKEFCDEMKTRIGVIVELKADYWDSVAITATLKKMIDEQMCLKIISSINSLIPQDTFDSAIYQSVKLVWFDLREVLNLMKKDKMK